jgi:hypothetical protein
MKIAFGFWVGEEVALQGTDKTGASGLAKEDDPIQAHSVLCI